MNLISWLYKNDSSEEILNFAFKTFRDNYFDANTAFRRLKRRYPSIPVQTIETYVQECEKANTYGVEWIQSAATKETKPKKLGNNNKLRQQFNEIMIEKFPWVDKSNLSSLYSWTCHGLLFDD
jgi:hypothetical protein